MKGSVLAFPKVVILGSEMSSLPFMETELWHPACSAWVCSTPSQQESKYSLHESRG